MTLDSAERFTSRVRDYVRYRPGYPPAAVAHIADQLDIAPGRLIADVGAGTGLLTRSLLQAGAEVIAIDPNEHMLDAARELLAGQRRASFVVASAEDTTLDDHSVDAITVGQAFHWFEHEAARDEFRRILRPGGCVALMWNTKRFDTSEFLAGYEQLLERHAPAFADVRHETSDEATIEAFFGAPPTRAEFDNEQRFDWDGVLGRAMSASYVPREGAPHHAAFVVGLRELWEAHAVDGCLVWPYATVVWAGPLVQRP